MPTKEISQLFPKGSNLSPTDLLEVSVVSGAAYASKRITGQQLINGTLPNFKNYIYGFRLIPDYSSNSTTVRIRGAAPLNISYVNDSICVDSTGSYVIGTSALLALKMDISTNGALGLDTGTAAVNTRYFAYIISKSSDPTNSANISAVASLSYTGVAGGLVLPPGYDIYRLIGSFKTKVSSTNICEFLQSGVGNERTCIYAADIGQIHIADVINSGVVNVNLTPYVSQLSSFATLNIKLFGLHGDNVIIRSSETWDVYINRAITVQVDNLEIEQEVTVGESQAVATLNQIGVIVSAFGTATASLYCKSFIESI